MCFFIEVVYVALDEVHWGSTVMSSDEGGGRWSPVFIVHIRI